MKNLKFLSLGVICGLFLSWKASAQAIEQHSNVISIQKSYSNEIPASLQSRLDSTIHATVNRFNNGLHAFSVTVNDSSAAQNIKLNIRSGKLATKKQRHIAYLVNLIVPVYIPMHKIKSSMEFQLPEEVGKNVRPINSKAHILIGNITKREDKLLQKYADKLFYELNDMETQMRPAFSSSVR